MNKEIIKGFKQIKCDLPIKDCEDCQNTIMDLLEKSYKKGKQERNAEVKKLIEAYFIIKLKKFEGITGMSNLSVEIKDELLQKLGLEK